MGWLDELRVQIEGQFDGLSPEQRAAQTAEKYRLQKEAEVKAQQEAAAQEAAAQQAAQQEAIRQQSIQSQPQFRQAPVSPGQEHIQPYRPATDTQQKVKTLEELMKEMDQQNRGRNVSPYGQATQ